MQTSKLIITYAVTMLIFASVSAGILALTHQLTEHKRIANMQQREFLARQELVPTAVSFVPAKAHDYRFTKGLNKDKMVAGYLLKAVRRGYSSNIETLIAVNNDFSIMAIKVLAQNETPGLGAKIETPWFTKQFGLLKGTAIAVRKDGGAIDALTGATISSRAVAESVRLEVASFQKAMQK